MDHLERMRKRKAEAAQGELLRARRHLAHAEHHVQTLGHNRAQMARQAQSRTQSDLAAVTAQTVSMTALAAIHEDAARREAQLAALDAEITRATADREVFRQMALERQNLFLKARKASEKLGLLAETLRSTEKSLQTRLNESQSDSAIKDETTGRWTVLQADQ